jgi:hypothetical protein
MFKSEIDNPKNSPGSLKTDGLLHPRNFMRVENKQSHPG